MCANLKGLRCGAGASYIGSSVAGRIPSVAKAAVAQMAAMTQTRAGDSRRKGFRCGEGARYFALTERFDEGRRDTVSVNRLSKDSSSNKRTRAGGFPPERDTGMVKSRVTSSVNEAGQQFRGCA